MKRRDLKDQVIEVWEVYRRPTGCSWRHRASHGLYASEVTAKTVVENMGADAYCSRRAVIKVGPHYYLLARLQPCHIIGMLESGAACTRFKPSPDGRIIYDLLDQADPILRLDGDFDSDRDRIQYTESVCAKLNQQVPNLHTGGSISAEETPWQVAGYAQLINYPDAWNTEKFPTLELAVRYALSRFVG